MSLPGPPRDSSPEKYRRRKKEAYNMSMCAQPLRFTQSFSETKLCVLAPETWISATLGIDRFVGGEGKREWDLGSGCGDETSCVIHDQCKFFNLSNIPPLYCWFRQKQDTKIIKLFLDLVQKPGFYSQPGSPDQRKQKYILIINLNTYKVRRASKWNEMYIVDTAFKCLQPTPKS